MSTQEVFVQRAKCYCGTGIIEREFYSPDNPYSTAYTGNPTIKCPICALNWAAWSEDVLVPNKEAPHNPDLPPRFRPDWKFC